MSVAQHFHECKRLRENQQLQPPKGPDNVAKRRIFATLPVMSRAIKYAGAIAIATAAIALRWLLIPWLGSDVPYATLIGAIAIAVWMGGCGTGARRGDLRICRHRLRHRQAAR